MFIFKCSFVYYSCDCNFILSEIIKLFRNLWNNPFFWSTYHLHTFWTVNRLWKTQSRLSPTSSLPRPPCFIIFEDAHVSSDTNLFRIWQVHRPYEQINQRKFEWELINNLIWAKALISFFLPLKKNPKPIKLLVPVSHTKGYYTTSISTHSAARLVVWLKYRISEWYRKLYQLIHEWTYCR